MSPRLSAYNSARMKKEDLNDLHFGLGMWIRNNFGFFQENFELLADCAKQSGETLPLHEDDASTVILEALWERLQEPS